MKFSARHLPLAFSLALAACGSDRPGQPVSGETTGAAASAAASMAPDAKPGLALTEARLVLPAVHGNPGAVYFTLTNGSAKAARIAAIDVAGAGMAMLHETRQIGGHSAMQALDDPEVPAGGNLVLSPGGKHVMVDAIPADWRPGGTIELTLIFADGDKLSAPIRLDAPGG